MEKITIVVPVYNVEKYIERCLESICNQTYKNLEIICIDDGSTDNTLFYLKKYAQQDNRIIIVENKHQGVAATRNLGLELATGDFIGFVDSDDYIDLKMYETLHHIIKSQKTDLAICGFKRIYEDFGHRKDSDEFYDNRTLFKPGKSIITNEVISHFMITLWSKLYKTQIIKENQISFKNNLIFEDWVFYWEYLTHSDSLYFLENKMYFYCQHENSIMASIYENPEGGADRTMDYMYTAEVIYDNLIKRNIFDKYQKSFWRCYALIYENAYYFINDRKKEDIKSRAKMFLENLELHNYKNNMSVDDYVYLNKIVNPQASESDIIGLPLSE